MVFTVLFSLTHTLYIVFYIIPESYALLCGCWGIPSYSRLSCMFVASLMGCGVLGKNFLILLSQDQLQYLLVDVKTRHTPELN